MVFAFAIVFLLSRAQAADGQRGHTYLAELEAQMLAERMGDFRDEIAELMNRVNLLDAAVRASEKTEREFPERYL